MMTSEANTGQELLVQECFSVQGERRHGWAKEGEVRGLMREIGACGLWTGKGGRVIELLGGQRRFYREDAR